MNEQQSNRPKLEDLGVYIENVPPETWDNIAGMANEKKLIDSTIVLPLRHPEIALKHGVVSPKAILLFGPPGTGKTYFTRGISGRLGWAYLEISPGSLQSEGLEKQALKLKALFEKFLEINRAVIFIDEFEELALRPDVASDYEKIVSSEMLREIPRLRAAHEVLLICATNNIRLLNPALLRPGRFDFILPIGPLDIESRQAIFKMYLRNMNVGKIDFPLIASRSRYYTPADIQEICAQAARAAFEKEIAQGKEYIIQTQDMLQVIESHRATTAPEQLREFTEDIRRYCRADYCSLLLETL